MTEKTLSLQAPSATELDRLDSISPEEFDQAVPAQTPEEDEMILREIFLDLEERPDEAFEDDELKRVTDSLSQVIGSAVVREGRYADIHKIPELYAPKLERMVRHYSVPQDNHAWRLVSPLYGALDVRTGPFYDEHVKTSYQPLLRVTPPKQNSSFVSDNNPTLIEAVKIIADVFPKNPALIQDLNLLVGN